MRTTVLIPLCILSLVTASPVRAQSDNLTPLKERVNVQADSARTNQIIDGCWVAVGTNKPHTMPLCKDSRHFLIQSPRNVNRECITHG